MCNFDPHYKTFKPLFKTFGVDVCVIRECNKGWFLTRRPQKKVYQNTDTFYVWRAIHRQYKFTNNLNRVYILRLELLLAVVLQFCFIWQAHYMELAKRNGIKL